MRNSIRRHDPRRRRLPSPLKLIRAHTPIRLRHILIQRAPLQLARHTPRLLQRVDEVVRRQVATISSPRIRYVTVKVKRNLRTIAFILGNPISWVSFGQGLLPIEGNLACKALQFFPIPHTRKEVVYMYMIQHSFEISRWFFLSFDPLINDICIHVSCIKVQAPIHFDFNTLQPLQCFLIFCRHGTSSEFVGLGGLGFPTNTCPDGDTLRLNSVTCGVETPP